MTPFAGAGMDLGVSQTSGYVTLNEVINFAEVP